MDTVEKIIETFPVKFYVEKEENKLPKKIPYIEKEKVLKLIRELQFENNMP